LQAVKQQLQLVKVYENITYYLPNAFSPNGDGLNEIFRPIPAGIVSTDWFRIFSRYGVLVFETSQMNKGWDGMFKGIKQPVGNYVWSIKGKGRDGKVVELKGNVVLVR
jgi:gliding motility-associated-like protein